MKCLFPIDAYVVSKPAVAIENEYASWGPNWSQGLAKFAEVHKQSSGEDKQQQFKVQSIHNGFKYFLKQYSG